MEPIYRIVALVIGLLVALAWFQFTAWRRKKTVARRATEAGAAINYWERPAIRVRSRSNIA